MQVRYGWTQPIKRIRKNLQSSFRTNVKTTDIGCNRYNEALVLRLLSTVPFLLFSYIHNKNMSLGRYFKVDKLNQS